MSEFAVERKCVDVEFGVQTSSPRHHSWGEGVQELQSIVPRSGVSMSVGLQGDVSIGQIVWSGVDMLGAASVGAWANVESLVVVAGSAHEEASVG